ncbi:hypothetical protein M404DRAFT_167237 [Pisolithus tinctorius Marx 270]|uniref:ribonuclease H n=1 Tax=Pisolithus tinctorius Marx 270 TaxID=870435 RepID=A0A0C3NGL0_PISTI|nr:hypothetical protein M404DRAFT_167237 [Pisolithus tinctorius Marx 270]
MALHHLFHNLEVNPRAIEEICPCLLPPSALPTHAIAIAPNKKEAVKSFAKIQNWTLVFTDGSCTSEGVGAAAVLYVDYQHLATLHYRLGSASEHTVFKAEATALLLAAHLLTSNTEVTFPASILADNQAVIRSTKPGHYLLMHFRSMIQDLHKSNRLSRKDIMLQWIAGHMEIEGNELADREAKLAAKRDEPTSPPEALPPALAERLPLSVSTLKQTHATKLKVLWNNEWWGSPHYSRISCIDPLLPGNTFVKLTASLPKR